jgi:predicted ATP-dependent endonuclease of OLD family
MMPAMMLSDCWIHGLRRFGGERSHRVRLDAKVVCFIGANEAGESTILDALEFAQSPRQITQADRTRGEAVPKIVQWLAYAFDYTMRTELPRPHIARYRGSATLDARRPRWV